MLKFLLQRLLAIIPVLLVVAIVVFLILRLTPGDPAAVIAGDSATTEQIEQIRAQLEQGESVKLSGFGNFQLRDKPQRPGRNPKTGEEIPITARRVVTFHPSQKLKTMVEKSYHGKPQA